MFHTYKKAPYQFPTIVVMLLLLASCTVVKNYPKNQPFVFKNKITIEGDLSKDEKNKMLADLPNYWDDSIKVKSVTKFGFKTIIKDPFPLSERGVERSHTFMKSYLQAQGYYYPELRDSIYKTDTVKDQYRVTVEMVLDVKKNLKIDSFSFDLENPDLKNLANENLDQSLLELRKPFSNQLVANELDRLVTLYRKSGYYRITRENLYAEVDTTFVPLLDLSIDPFEQARIIEEAIKEKKKNPTIGVFIKQKPSADSSAFTRFYVGNVFYYPQTNFTTGVDSLIGRTYPIERSNGAITMKEITHFIHFRPFREHTILKKGQLYNEGDYFKTVNNVSQLGTWNQVDVRTVFNLDSVPTIDFHFFLTPAPKFPFGTDFEVSRNTGSIITGNLVGLAHVITLRNTNNWRGAIQSTTNFRYGIELGSGVGTRAVQTFQLSLSQGYSIPKLIKPGFIKLKVKKFDSYKTLVNFNGAYTDRRDFFKLRSFTSSFGYEVKWKNKVVQFSPVNIELYSLDTLDGLKRAFITNPFLRTAFNTGNVISQVATYSVTYPSRKNSKIQNNFRVSGELSGLLTLPIKSLEDKVYRYLKVETEFRKRIPIRKTELAYRLFGGAGYNYSNNERIGQSLPFFKQFVAGGPSSMRAWQLRQLGLGASLQSDTSTSFRDRYGDIQLETNLEYRFPLFTFSGFKFNSAFFTDIGNIWNLKPNADNPLGQFKLDRLLGDIAIGVGTGLRIDFNYVMIRVDFAYKVKDPARLKNNGWVSLSDFEWTNYEFGVKRNNYAFQLGFGLPF